MIDQKNWHYYMVQFRMVLIRISSFSDRPEEKKKKKNLVWISNCSQINMTKTKSDKKSFNTYKNNFIDSIFIIFPFAGWDNLIYFPYSLHNFDVQFRKFNKHGNTDKVNLITARSSEKLT